MYGKFLARRFLHLGSIRCGRVGLMIRRDSGVPGGDDDNHRRASFLADLLRETRRPLVVVWDGGNMRRGDPIRDLLGRVGRRLRLERLPPYAPLLNPVESLWTWVKYGRLCNFAPRDAAHLNDVLLTELAAIRNDQERLRSFCRASELGDVLT